MMSRKFSILSSFSSLLVLVKSLDCGIVVLWIVVFSNPDNPDNFWFFCHVVVQVISFTDFA